MPNAKDFNPVEHGLTITLIGPPGSGKSEFARTAVKHYERQGEPARSFAVIAPTAELASYAGLNLDYEPLVDEGFDAAGFTLGLADKSKLTAKAYNDYTAILDRLEKSDQYHVVIHDTMSKAVDRAVWNAIMSVYGQVLTQQIKNTYAPYVQYVMWMERIVNRLDLLRYRKKVHMIMLWHSDAKELEGHGKMRTEVEEGKKVVRWDTALQAEAHGRAFPPQVLAWSDLAFFTEPIHDKGPDGKPRFRCRLIAMPDELRLPKTRLPGVMARFTAMSEIPNDFPTILKIVEECYAAKPQGGKP